MLTHKYTTFGLNIVSEIELPELYRWNGVEPDLSIRIGDVPDNICSRVSPGDLFQYSDNEFLFKSRNSGKFLLKDHKTLIVQKYGNSTDTDVRVLLLSVVLGIVLHRKKKFPLHASAVEIDGRAILFSGPCGVGKSTIAAGLVQRGHKFISDDITVIERVGEKLLSVPSFPKIKLWSDSLAALGYDSSKFQTIRPRVDKKIMEIERMSREPIVLDSIYFLSTDHFFENRIETLDVHERMRLLAKNTYRIHHLKLMGDSRNHFQACCSIAEEARIFSLRRTTDGFDLDNLLDRIESDLSDKQN
jgi:hypothetical protein